MSTLERTYILLVVASLFILIYLLQPILMPFLVGIGLAYLGDPVVDRLESRGVGRTSAVLVVFVVFFFFFAIGLLVLIPLLMRELGSLIRDIPVAIGMLQEQVGPFLLANFGVDTFDLNLDSLKSSLSSNWQQAGGIAGTIIKKVTASGVVLLTTVANIALIPVVAFYLMRDWDLLMSKFRALIPRGIESLAVQLARECDEVLSAFLRGQLLIMIALGCIYATGLAFIGLDLAILIGMMAGLASVVPYLGFIVGIIAAGMASAFQFHDLLHLAYVAAVFGFGQLLEGTVLTPLLVGDRIGLHPVAVIFAVLAGGQLFGFVGVLLALPVAAVVMVFLRHLHDRYKISRYYGVPELAQTIQDDSQVDSDIDSGIDSGTDNESKQ